MMIKKAPVFNDGAIFSKLINIFTDMLGINPKPYQYLNSSIVILN